MSFKKWMAVLIIVCMIACYAAFEMKFSSLEQGLRRYLINELQYQPSDIVSIEASYSSLPKFPVIVHFADDPRTAYVFTDRGVSQWRQLSPSTPTRLEVQKKKLINP